jgi:hypothetical protein
MDPLDEYFANDPLILSLGGVLEQIAADDELEESGYGKAVKEAYNKFEASLIDTPRPKGARIL